MRKPAFTKRTKTDPGAVSGASVAGVTGNKEAEALVSRIVRAIDAIDVACGKAADNWRLDRLAVVDRNILRIGVYDAIYGPLGALVALGMFAYYSGIVFILGAEFTEALRLHKGRS